VLSAVAGLAAFAWCSIAAALAANPLNPNSVVQSEPKSKSRRTPASPAAAHNFTAPDSEPPKPVDDSARQTIEDLFHGGFGQDMRPILEHPEKLEAFRIAPEIDLTAENRLAGYRILSGPTEVDIKLGREVGAVLVDKKTYNLDPSSTPFCGFAPGVALRFSGKDAKGHSGRVCILLCFTCDGAKIHVPLEDDHGHVNTAPGRTRLITLVKRLFPKDAAIQALKDERSDDGLAEPATAQPSSEKSPAARPSKGAAPSPRK
jgi:hypothetical protein